MSNHTFPVINLVDNALHIGCLHIDKLLQPNIVVVSCGQYCCFALDEKDEVITHFPYSMIFFSKCNFLFQT